MDGGGWKGGWMEVGEREDGWRAVEGRMDRGGWKRGWMEVGGREDGWR